VGPGHKEKASIVYGAFKEWHRASGEPGEPMSLRRFGEEVRRDGIEVKRSNGKWYHGVAVRTPFEDGQEE
jgi:hypothetical protein